jgi:dUTP pyrophosphatase
MEIRFSRNNDNAKLPIRGTEYSAAFDLYSGEDLTVTARSRCLVDTGLKLSECPRDVYLRIAPRSGLAVKGYDIGAGVVDSDYRGPVKVLFINTTDDDYSISTGDRIAQMIPERIRTDLRCVINGEENDTSEVIRTERGEGGFGSTQ